MALSVRGEWLCDPNAGLRSLTSCLYNPSSPQGNEWKRDFNRGVSGVHSAVSASIIEAMFQSGDEEKALDEYRRRLRDEPDAVCLPKPCARPCTLRENCCVGAGTLRSGPAPWHL